MTEKESLETTEVERSYLDVGPTGPRKWLLAVGALFVGMAIMAAFYGLYTINRDASPTLTPDPQALTQVATAMTNLPDETTPGNPPLSPTPTLTATPAIVVTAEPPTYTVQGGDTLIAIAHRLNVNADDLATLNQLSGETIYPNQVLVVPPTVTPWPETGPFPHIVSQGETLLSIAALYHVKVQDIKTLNALTTDTIYVGQQVLIPAEGVRPPTPTPTPEPWQPAIITGSLDAVYSITKIKGHYTLHIPPNTRAAAESEIAKIAGLLETALDYTQQALQHQVSGRFDVYIVESLFDTPHTNQRSLSQPDENRIFFLHDGSGTPTERIYFATFALTHLIARQVLGESASPLLSEGLAVYAGELALAGEMGQGQRYLTPTEFCVAYHQAGQLAQVSRQLTFDGHLGHMDQYFAAGCFVAYLIQEEGFSAFSQVYLDGDYQAVYGRTLSQLGEDWIVSLRKTVDDLWVDSDELVRVATDVDAVYRLLWVDFEGTPAQFDAYKRLDRARLSLLLGRTSIAQEHLDVLDTLLNDQ